MIDEFFPILLYGTAEFVKPGELYHCKETDLSPEYIVCHPSDLEQIKKLLSNRRLVHIKDEPQEKALERIKRLLTKGYSRRSLYAHSTWKRSQKSSKS